MKLFTKITIIKIQNKDIRLYNLLRRGHKIDIIRDRIRKIETVKGNVILDEGAKALWLLLTGSPDITPFDNSNACIGVGDGTEPEDTTQKGLTGTNRAYKGMDQNYPTVQERKIIFRSTFGPNDANFHWYEITVANGCSDDAINLNRRQVDLGEKTSDETWMAIMEITIQ